MRFRTWFWVLGEIGLLILSVYKIFVGGRINGRCRGGIFNLGWRGGKVF